MCHEHIEQCIPRTPTYTCSIFPHSTDIYSLAEHYHNISKSDPITFHHIAIVFDGIETSKLKNIFVPASYQILVTVNQNLYAKTLDPLAY